ncbi:MAG: hypothetical protein ACM3OB_06170 [Acidobacteriota bacterium]
MRISPFRILAALALAAFAVCAPAAAAAHTLHGQVLLLAKGGKVVDKSADVRNAVVVFRPKAGTKALATNQVFRMVTRQKEFVPRVLAVPVGSTVQFPNDDPILHNAFTVSEGNRFDMGLYRKGEGKRVVFKTPGLVRVFCNIHQSMVAYIMVVDTPYFAMPDASGHFALSGVPDGPGTLEVWHEQTEVLSLPVTVPSAAAVQARLEVTKPRVPPHLNKLGQSYSRGNRGDNY